MQSITHEEKVLVRIFEECQKQSDGQKLLLNPQQFSKAFELNEDYKK